MTLRILARNDQVGIAINRRKSAQIENKLLFTQLSKPLTTWQCSSLTSATTFIAISSPMNGANSLLS